MDSILKRPETEQIKIAKFSRNEAILEVLAKSPSSKVHLAIAQNDSAPVKVLDDFSKNMDNTLLCRTVAKNKKTSNTTLSRLSLHSDNDVRGYVANNENTSTETLKILAADYIVDEEALKVLGKRGIKSDTLVFTTSEYAQNPNTSPITLSKIVEDKTLHPEVRISAIKNSSTPEKAVVGVSKKVRGEDDIKVVAEAISEVSLRQGMKQQINQRQTIEQPKSKNRKRGIKL
jgi:hypothetical protein